MVSWFDVLTIVQNIGQGIAAQCVFLRILGGDVVREYLAALRWRTLDCLKIHLEEHGASLSRGWITHDEALLLLGLRAVTLDCLVGVQVADPHVVFGCLDILWRAGGSVCVEEGWLGRRGWGTDIPH